MFGTISLFTLWMLYLLMLFTYIVIAFFALWLTFWALKMFYSSVLKPIFYPNS